MDVLRKNKKRIYYDIWKHFYQTSRKRAADPGFAAYPDDFIKTDYQKAKGFRFKSRPLPDFVFYLFLIIIIYSCFCL